MATSGNANFVGQYTTNAIIVMRNLAMIPQANFLEIKPGFLIEFPKAKMTEIQDIFGSPTKAFTTENREKVNFIFPVKIKRDTIK
jgi:hypothetical protein